jgi:hypothetical protein
MGSFGHRVIGSLTDRVIGSLNHWVIEKLSVVSRPLPVAFDFSKWEK